MPFRTFRLPSQLIYNLSEAWAVQRMEVNSSRRFTFHGFRNKTAECSPEYVGETKCSLNIAYDVLHATPQSPSSVSHTARTRTKSGSHWARRCHIIMTRGEQRQRPQCACHDSRGMHDDGTAPQYDAINQTEKPTRAEVECRDCCRHMQLACERMERRFELFVAFTFPPTAFTNI